MPVCLDYGTARQAGGTLFNMNFDKVLINVNRSGRNLREQYHEQRAIQLIFDGEFDDRRLEETRTVVLVRQRAALVSVVQADNLAPVFVKSWCHFTVLLLKNAWSRCRQASPCLQITDQIG
ncbi:hypothetical protein ALON55S_04197 [Alishewanella longhuensis]